MRWATLVAGLCLVSLISAFGQEVPPEPPAMPGIVEGTGASFAVTDSDYLNVTLQSSEAVTVKIESIPSIVAVHLEAAEGAAAAQITMGGLAASTTYYKHVDTYQVTDEITTDSTGSYSWSQDLAEPHFVWFQPNPSTKFLRDDATGGDCTSIGTWDPATGTCTLGMNVYETIEIANDNLTLDGAGYTVQGSGNGIWLYRRTGVTIKNVTIAGFNWGINLVYRNTNNTLTGNTFLNNGYALHIYNQSNNNTVAGNTFSNNASIGIYVEYHSYGNTLTDNTISNSSRGIVLDNDASSNTLTGNTVSNTSTGIYIWRDGSNNILTGNTVSDSSYGIYLNSNCNDNEIYNNRFVGNRSYHARVNYCTGNVFNLPAPIGGNYWSDWTSPDSDGDGFVDVPYTFSGGVDDLPWATPDGWEAPADGDSDGVPNTADNCPAVPNPDQVDQDGDGIGDVCDPNPLGLCAPLPDGMLAWWPGDGDARDVWGGYDATPVNGVGFATGRVGEAFRFDAVTSPMDDRIDLPPEVVDGLVDLTVDFWINTTDPAGSVLNSASPGGDNEFNLFSWSDPGFEVTVRRDIWKSAYPVSDGEWHHVAATREGGTTRLYIDGALRDSHDSPIGALSVGTGGFMLGQEQDCLADCLDPNQAFDGLLDELKIYDRALTAPEIAEIYEAGSAGICRTGLDSDGDGVPNVDDNCVDDPNPAQNDTDLDGQGDACDIDDDDDGVLDAADNCPFNANQEQFDVDADGLGDVCDSDLDGDGVVNETDNCATEPNPYQDNTDGDAQGDACDEDDDDDGVCDTDQEGAACGAGPDNCATLVNPDQADFDGDAIGDVCDADVDGDGIDNEADNCVWAANPSQDDTDFDGDGDACDEDDDNDSWFDWEDNCPLVYNLDQSDFDGDGLGDACDADLDGDGVDNELDNCPMVANSGQADLDGDELGDACDPDVDGDEVANTMDLCAATPADTLVDPGNGCSIDQLCPCAGPRGTNQPWKNHGKYVSSVAHATEGFLALGLITEQEKGALMSAAGQSECGHK